MKPSLPPKQIISRNPRTSSHSQNRYNRGSYNRTPYRRGDEHTSPKVKYIYEEVTWENFLDNRYTGKKTIRSSFIPYFFGQDGLKYWVLGSFVDYPQDILTDFGGTCIIYDPPLKKKQRDRGVLQQEHYQHQFGCALTELNEESKGLLVKPVLKSLGVGVGVQVYRGYDRIKNEYVWFVMVPVNYDEVSNVINMFPDTPNVLKKEKLGPLGFYAEVDMINKKHRTSRNLTDFVNYLRG